MQILISHLLNECVNLGFKDIYCNQVEYHPFLSQAKLLEVMQDFELFRWHIAQYVEVMLQDMMYSILAEKYSKTPAQIALRWIISTESCIDT